MDVNQMLESSGAIDAIAGQLGVSPDVARMGANALLPSLLSGFGSTVQSHEATPPADGGLGSLLESLGGSGLLDNVIGPQPTEVNKGNEILGQIFGTKEVSRGVAGEAAQSTGIDPAILKQMLPILAMVVAGYVTSRSKAQGGGLGGVLGPLIGSIAGGSTGGMSGGLGGALGGMLGSILGGRR